MIKNRWLVSLGCALCFSVAAQAAEPPLRILVPFAPGGGVDSLTRLIARQLEQSLDRQVIVENRPGGNGVVATNVVARAEPDGNTLIMVGMSHAVNPILVEKLPYDTKQDLTAVTMVATSPLVLVTSLDKPYNDVGELLAYARENPGAVAYGSGGNGSSAHMAGVMLASVTGIDIEHIAYQGTAAAYPDLVSGRLPLLIDNTVIPLRMRSDNKIKILGATTAQRSQLLSDIPTLQEQGVKDFDVGAWFGVVAPGGSPDAVLARLADAINATLETEQVQEAFKTQGLEAAGTSPAEFAAFVDAEIDRWSAVMAPPSNASR